ncbi:hypothetical protein MRB53_004391 [Persea americana]|uniref:Uncharacterized protein n=1 Tax=Persea americana TaxID=3435 RepID=A0ACC2MB27_PERAE|nr:hypothetical protein MRB53_004391 [Persea americana]
MDAKKAINLARVVLTLGIIAFFLGFGAEISKPASGTPISGGVGTCTYPQYDSIVLGSLCAVSFLGFFILGLVCLFYIYNGVPIKALTWGTNLFFAFTVARADYLRSDPHYRPGGNRNETTSPKGLECNKIHPVLSEDA